MSSLVNLLSALDLDTSSLSKGDDVSNRFQHPVFSQDTFTLEELNEVIEKYRK